MADGRCGLSRSSTRPRCRNRCEQQHRRTRVARNRGVELRVDHVRFYRGGDGMVLSDRVTAAATDSSAAHNAGIGFGVAASTANAVLSLERVASSSNAIGRQASGENAFVLVSNSSITGNDLGSFRAGGSKPHTRITCVAAQALPVGLRPLIRHQCPNPPERPIAGYPPTARRGADGDAPRTSNPEAT